MKSKIRAFIVSALSKTNFHDNFYFLLRDAHHAKMKKVFDEAFGITDD